MSYIFIFIAGFTLHFAYSKGWLVTPAIFIVKTVKGWFENDAKP